MEGEPLSHTMKECPHIIVYHLIISEILPSNIFIINSYTKNALKISAKNVIITNLSFLVL